MPGRNGTGPLGMGPMTGRGMGLCRTGRRPRMGLGFGYGRGMGRYASYNDYPVEPMTPETERATLEDERAMLEARLREIENRLNDNE